MNKLRYHTNCVDSNAHDIHEMIDMEGVGHDIRNILSYSDLKAALPEQFWRNFNCSKEKEFKDDWHIRYYESHFQGNKCIYIVHSAIEYIYLQNDATTLDDDEARVRQAAIEELNEGKDEFEDAIISLANKISNESPLVEKSSKFASDKSINLLIKAYPEESMRALCAIKKHIQFDVDGQQLMSDHNLVVQNIEPLNQDKNYCLFNNLYHFLMTAVLADERKVKVPAYDYLTEGAKRTVLRNVGNNRDVLNMPANELDEKVLNNLQSVQLYMGMPEFKEQFSAEAVERVTDSRKRVRDNIELSVAKSTGREGFTT